MTTQNDGNDAYILLDLNYPEFQKCLFELDTNELKKILTTFKKISRITWQQLFADHGLKWEEIKASRNRYTIRVSLKYRAVVIRENRYMRFQLLVTNHDSAYK